MMALFGSIAHAPLAVMLMVAEMTGNLSLLAPAMVAVGARDLVVGDKTIYRSQLPAAPTRRPTATGSRMPLLAAVPVGDAARQARLVLRTDEPVGEALDTDGGCRRAGRSGRRSRRHRGRPG